MVRIIALLLLACLAGAAFWWWTRSQGPGGPAPVDRRPVMEVNNHGVGLMGQLDYRLAVKDFEQVVQMAPDWQLGHINQGIALLNLNNDESRARTQQIFDAVLSKDPDNLHAHYCLGILNLYAKDSSVAISHFETVVRLDPNDALTWAWLGLLQVSDAKKRAECYRKALALNPNLLSALNNVQLGNEKAMQKLLSRMQSLEEANWADRQDITYHQMGRYANVITHPESLRREPPVSPLPRFRRKNQFEVHLAAGTRWAKAADFGATEVGRLRAAVRARFGATLVVLDYNGDDKPDLFLIGAVVEKGRVRNLLLRNEGDGSFTDFTAAAHLDFDHPTLGCCVADFDNDGFADLFLTGAGSQCLLRNNGNGTFEDVTEKSATEAMAGEGLTDLKSVCLGSFFVDVDQDSALDLLVAEYARTNAEALRLLEGQGGKPSGSLHLYLHAGTAPPHNKREEPQPLEVRFERSSDLPDQKPAPCVALTVSDLESDHDVDLLLLADGATPSAILNDRLLDFRRQELPSTIAPPSAWNGGLVFDANHDGISDLLLLRADKPPLLLLNRMSPPGANLAQGFEAGTNDSPPLLQAVVADVNLDSWTDVVGLSAQRRPVLLKNERNRLTWHKEAFGPDSDWPGNVIAVNLLDSEAQCRPDLLVWSEEKGLQLYENSGNGNHGLVVQLMGHTMNDAGKRLRSNRDAIGTWAVAQAHEVWAGQENTTLSAGLGQSRRPLLLGLNRYNKADVLRLRWPDLLRQAELDLASGKLLSIEEHDRRVGW
jgi:tetratricopeptide (TPR) repeat protein